MTDDQQFDSLRKRAQQLPRTLQPGPHLWDRVEAEMGGDPDLKVQDIKGAEGLQPTKHLWPIAALTLVGVALATLVFQSVRPQPDLAEGQLDTSRQVPVTMPVSSPVNPVMQTQMQAQMHELLDAQLDDLPEEVRATVIENLEIIAAARAEIREALDQNPNSPLLHSLYLNSYANERTLLKDVEAMARQTKRRTYL